MTDEKKILFSAFETPGIKPPEGRNVQCVPPNWPWVKGESVTELFGLGEVPLVEDVLYMSREGYGYHLRVSSVEALTRPSNYHWRAEVLVVSTANLKGISKIKLDGLGASKETS